MNPIYRCYFLPIIGGILFYILCLPNVEAGFTIWIPNVYYRLFAKALLVVCILFICCRLFDGYCCYQHNP